MQSKIEQYVNGCLVLEEGELRQDDEEVLEVELDKIWHSMTDEERRLAEKELNDIDKIKRGEYQ